MSMDSMTTDAIRRASMGEVLNAQQPSLSFTHNTDEVVFERLLPYFSELVRRAKEDYHFFDMREIKSYLYGIFESGPEGPSRDLCFRLIDRLIANLLAPQPDNGLSWEELTEATKKEVLSILNSKRQPGAGGLLGLLEEKFDWRVRHIFASVIQQLRDDLTIQSYLRDYLKTTLSDEHIKSALIGGAKADREFKSTIDDLIRQSQKYRNSQAFQEMIEFTAKFRDYAPYNNFLVSLQKPGCSFYATARDWRDRFSRQIKEDANPILILAPMHPVMLVYDLDSTEGPQLPADLRNFGRTSGDWDPNYLDCTLENAVRDRILVQFKELSSTRGGFATSEAPRGDYKMRIVVNSNFDPKSRYTTLCHELAHIYLGHLGADKDNWWPCRINLTHRAVEIEAEAVSYIVGIRQGLIPSSDAYLSRYTGDGMISDQISVELIAKVAGKLMEMGERKMPPRKSLKKQVS